MFPVSISDVQCETLTGVGLFPDLLSGDYCFGASFTFRTR